MKNMHELDFSTINGLMMTADVTCNCKKREIVSLPLPVHTQTHKQSDYYRYLDGCSKLWKEIQP